MILSKFLVFCSHFWDFIDIFFVVIIHCICSDLVDFENDSFSRCTRFIVVLRIRRCRLWSTLWLIVVFYILFGCFDRWKFLLPWNDFDDCAEIQEPIQHRRVVILLNEVLAEFEVAIVVDIQFLEDRIIVIISSRGIDYTSWRGSSDKSVVVHQEEVEELVAHRRVNFAALMELNVPRIHLDLTNSSMDFPVHVDQGLLRVTERQDELLTDLLSKLVIKLNKCEADITLLKLFNDLVYIFDVFVANFH